MNITDDEPEQTRHQAPQQPLNTEGGAEPNKFSELFFAESRARPSGGRGREQHGVRPEPRRALDIGTQGEPVGRTHYRLTSYSRNTVPVFS